MLDSILPAQPAGWDKGCDLEPHTTCLFFEPTCLQALDEAQKAEGIEEHLRTRPEAHTMHVQPPPLPPYARM